MFSLILYCIHSAFCAHLYRCKSFLYSDIYKEPCFMYLISINNPSRLGRAYCWHSVNQAHICAKDIQSRLPPIYSTCIHIYMRFYCILFAIRRERAFASPNTLAFIRHFLYTYSKDFSYCSILSYLYRYIDGVEIIYIVRFDKCPI